jgi:hypothetical protein
VSWPLVEVPFPFPEGVRRVDLAPGSCWRIPLAYRYRDFPDGPTYGEDNADLFSPEFLASGRDAVVVIRLPGGADWSPDWKASGDGNGWTVTGEFPRITAHPSVNAVGTYHGWLTDGVLSNDVEGRVFPEANSAGEEVT